MLKSFGYLEMKAGKQTLFGCKSLVIHSLKHFIQMTLTVLGSCLKVNSLFAWYTF